MNSKNDYITKLAFLCIITTIIVTTFTLSKYESSVAGSDNTMTAVPVIDLSTNVIELKIEPEEEKLYSFVVSNEKDGQKSEVSMEYTIQIESLANLPLEFELYREEDEEQTTNLFKNNGSITEKIQMSVADEPQSYRLKIKWRESDKSYLYSETIDYIKIVLDSSQKD